MLLLVCNRDDEQKKIRHGNGAAHIGQAHWALLSLTLEGWFLSFEGPALDSRLDAFSLLILHSLAYFASPSLPFTRITHLSIEPSLLVSIPLSVCILRCIRADEIGIYRIALLRTACFCMCCLLVVDLTFELLQYCLVWAI